MHLWIIRVCKSLHNSPSLTHADADDADADADDADADDDDGDDDISDANAPTSLGHANVNKILQIQNTCVVKWQGKPDTTV